MITALAVFLTTSEAQYLYGSRAQYVDPYGRVGAIARPQYIARQQYVVQPQYVAPQPRYVEDESYKPFSFAYNTVDEFGTQLGRQEEADGSGTVRGQYSYRDPLGIFRQVEYVADQAGFRAVVNTNEPGVKSHKPADAVYIKHEK
jgi:hypothetical protein